MQKCLSLDSIAPPSELLEICELSLDKMGSIFDDTNVYVLHMMYQAMGVCLYMEDWDGALSYGEKIITPYRFNTLYVLYFNFSMCNVETGFNVWS